MIIVPAVLFVAGFVILAISFFAAKEANKREKGNATLFIKSGVACAIFTSAVATIILFAMPQYYVWQQNKAGEAELARAEQNRQIAIQEARAKEESAKSLANAEIIRAEGVAQANKIIGDSLQNNEAYIHYLWIEALRESSNEVIYIPTEAGIPITESARFKKQTGEAK
ncbi:MAG: hypothetical protein IJT47_03215 [Selenomonadaceae bacterium]|nr:hypothetical protein [Selenomonadaceae bacterium]MBQ7493422.1 hypothetical protein [Selenomonadaceae bacterium]